MPKHRLVSDQDMPASRIDEQTRARNGGCKLARSSRCYEAIVFGRDDERGHGNACEVDPPAIARLRADQTGLDSDAAPVRKLSNSARIRNPQPTRNEQGSAIAICVN